MTCPIPKDKKLQRNKVYEYRGVEFRQRGRWIEINGRTTNLPHPPYWVKGADGRLKKNYTKKSWWGRTGHSSKGEDRPVDLDSVLQMIDVIADLKIKKFS